MPPITDSEDTDEQFDEGFYYDGNSGGFAYLSQEGDTILCRELVGLTPTRTQPIEIVNEVIYDFPAESHPEDHEYRKVPEIAVQQPQRVAEEIYKHGYHSEPPVNVGDVRCGIAAFEFVDAITEFQVKEGFQDIDLPNSDNSDSG